MRTVSPDFPEIKREASSTPISVINRSLSSAGENLQFEVRGEIGHMLSLFSKRQKEPSSFRQYGDQFRRGVEAEISLGCFSGVRFTLIFRAR